MASKKKKQEGGMAGAPLWMVTYGDMMTLLLCFFILLFSFSTLDLVKFRSVIVELQGALGVLSGGPMVLNLGDIPAKQLTDNPSASTRQMEKIQEKIEEKVADEGQEGSIQTTLDERGLMIRFTDTVLFDLGKADIKPEALPVLQLVAEEIATVSNPVRIEGHTDPTPIHTVEFPSNWELSTARATAIIHFMIESGGIDPVRLSAAGFAYYHPVVPNNTPENRARNRRVDIIILKSDEEETRSAPEPTGEPRTPEVEPIDLLIDIEQGIGPVEMAGGDSHTGTGAEDESPQDEETGEAAEPVQDTEEIETQDGG